MAGPGHETDYDFVIAGGGSAGCVLASRLSEDPGTRVLLIEAGQDLPPGAEPAEIRSPAPIVIFHGTKYLWPGLRVHPFRARPGYSRFYEQARVLGGGSSVNAQVGNRGLPADYDEWRDLGADGWGWDDVLPFFRKLERDLDYGGQDQMHGAHGPMPVMRVLRPDWPLLSQRLAAAAEAQGLPDIVDQNAIFTDGHFAAAYTNENGQRVTAAMAYLPAEVRARPNLTLHTDSYVLSLDMDGTEARGLTYDHDGAERQVTAGEVILSMGALHSPAMLMRAGIGPRDVLDDHGIQLRHELDGVGRNLRDHPGTHICAFVKPGARLPAGSVKGGHVAMRFSSEIDGAPGSDLYMHSGVTSAWHGVGRRVAYFYFWLNKSTATGRVTLAGTDPRARPKVDMNLLGEPFDVKRLADGFRKVAALVRSPQMAEAVEHPFALRFSPFIRFMSQIRPRNARVMGLLGRLLDGPRELRRLILRHVISNAPPLDRLLADDALLEDYLRNNVMSVSHVTCTCRMGAAGDPAAVTDTEGRVHGTRRLRVVDASLMPALPRANTNLATIMIAEKIADAIRRERG